MKSNPSGKTILFSDEESRFLQIKHLQYSKQFANKNNDRFRCKKDIWDQISMDIQMKFNKMISSKQCATRLDTIQKRGKRKKSKMALHAKRNSILEGHLLEQYLHHDINDSSHKTNDEESNCDASLDYLNGSPQVQPASAELINASDCFYTINYPQTGVRTPAESVNPLSIISSVGLSRRPNILTPPVSTASSSSNNEITSTTLAAGLNPDRGEVPFLKKSLARERELVRTLQLQITHYESYIEILLQRINDLDNTRTNDVSIAIAEGSGEVKQEPT